MRVARFAPAAGVREQRQRPSGLLRKMGGASSGEGNSALPAAEAPHDSDSFSVVAVSLTKKPSAFLRRISTRPSASSNCFWHSRESATPSSKSFMASSSESCGLSRRRTTSSRRARERSKSGFLGGSGFLGLGEITRSASGPLETLISGNARNSMLTGCPVQCDGSALRNGGRVFLHGHTREEWFPVPGTTTRDRESRAPDANSILRHARERTQLLCAGGGLPAVSACWPGDGDRASRARALRKNKYCRSQPRVFDPARTLSRGVLTPRAICAIGCRRIRGRRSRTPGQDRRERRFRLGWRVPVAPWRSKTKEVGRRARNAW